MKKAISLSQQKRIKAQTKVRPFRHTFEVPGTAVVKSLPPNLGVPAKGQAMPNKEPKLNTMPWAGVKSSDPVQKRTKHLRNRSAKVG